MDIITMKLLERKFGVPMDILRCEINPLAQYEKLTNKTIRVAVQLYIHDRDECVRRFGQIENWNTRGVTCMKNLFYNLKNFNADISGWITSNVLDMSFMFYCAYNFNADISKWNTSNVVNTCLMFTHAKSFNADISGWNVSNCAIVNLMFFGARSFDRQFIQNWIMHPNVTKCSMFY